MPIILAALRWYFISAALLSILVAAQVFAGNAQHTNYQQMAIVVAQGASILVGFMLIVEFAVVPWRKKKLIKKIAKQFSGRILDDSCITFLLGTSLVYAQVHIKIKFATNLVALEFVHFSAVPINSFTSAKPTETEQLENQKNAKLVHTSSVKNLAKAEIILRKNLDSVAEI